jgi:hypothetical protein
VTQPRAAAVELNTCLAVAKFCNSMILHVAHVAELADALDSGFHFWPFFGITPRHLKTLKIIDLIGFNQFLTDFSMSC